MNMRYPVKGVTEMAWGSFHATIQSPDAKAWHIVLKNDGAVVYDGLKYVPAEEVPRVIEEKIRSSHRSCRPFKWAIVDGKERRLADFFVFEHPTN